MPRLMFGALFALVSDAARIANDDNFEATFLMGVSEEDQQWMAWGNDHIHPGTGEPIRQENGPSALVEDDSWQSPMGNYLTATVGIMLQPDSRMLFNNAFFVSRRRARQSGPIEGPMPNCPDMPVCAELIENATVNCSTWAVNNGPFAHLVPVAPLSFQCPTSCNTSYFTDSGNSLLPPQVSHCTMSISPCSETISECKRGYRQRTACVQPFSFQDELHDGCLPHPSGYFWCPHTDNVSGGDGAEFCDECIEEPVAMEVAGDWETVAKKLRCIEVGVTAGDVMERKYTFENRGRHLNLRQPFASGGKWLGAVSLAAAVHRGILEWDTLASDVFSWWTKNASDPRSRVSFRHLLNFNSGFYLQGSAMAFTHNGFQERCLTWGFARMWTPVSCAQQLYNQALHAGEPGRYFDYNSYHLQIAFGMVLQASGMEAREWLRVTLLEPAGMTDTNWMGGSNPLLSSGIMSTPNDHDAFLRKYLAYEILPKEIIDVVETEVLLANNVSLEYTSMNFSTWAMGHWIDGEFSRMGGMVFGCVNRRANIYVGAYPPPDSYADGVERFAIEWIKEDVERAVHMSAGVH